MPVNNSADIADIITLIRAEFDPIIKKYLEGQDGAYRRFTGNFRTKDEHPWLTDIRQAAKMLDGKLKLPHHRNNMPDCEICATARNQIKQYRGIKNEEMENGMVL